MRRSQVLHTLHSSFRWALFLYFREKMARREVEEILEETDEKLVLTYLCY